MRTDLRAAAVLSETPVVVTPGPVPTYVTGTTNAAFSATVGTSALATVQAGDVLVAFACGNDQATSVSASDGGWTELGSVAAGNVRTRIQTKVATGALGAITWTFPASHNHRVFIVAYRGAGTLTALGTTSNSATTAITLDLPTQTTTAGNALLVACGFQATLGDVRTWQGSMTARVEGAAATCGGRVADEAITTAGATGARTYTASTNTTTAKAILASSVVLYPA